MPKSNLRLYYKNQGDLSIAIKNYIEEYFQDNISQCEFESGIILIIDSNKDSFFKDGEIAKKPRQILGKKRIEVLEKVLKNRSEVYEKDSYIK